MEKRKKREHLELFWLAAVIGRAYRNTEGGIRVPVRYYEASTVKTRARSRSEGRTSQYKLGEIKTDLTTKTYNSR